MLIQIIRTRESEGQREARERNVALMMSYREKKRLRKREQRARRKAAKTSQEEERNVGTGRLKRRRNIK